MARKPAHAKTKTKNKAQRQAKKHQAKHQALRFKVLLGPLSRLWSRVPKTVRVPGMDHGVATAHVLAFVAVLGVAIGAGYGGARVLFGSDKPPAQQAVPQVSEQPNTQHRDRKSVV